MGLQITDVNTSADRATVTVETDVSQTQGIVEVNWASNASSPVDIPFDSTTFSVGSGTEQNDVTIDFSIPEDQTALVVITANLVSGGSGTDQRTVSISGSPAGGGGGGGGDGLPTTAIAAVGGAIVVAEVVRRSRG